MPNPLTSQCDEDRESIAREIHDGPCQYLTAAQIMFEVFQCETDDGSPNARASFDKGMALLSRAGEELRRLINRQPPALLDGDSLPHAIERLIAEARSCGAGEIEFHHDIRDDGADRLPESVKVGVLHIVQESISNACRQSGTDRVLVGLTLDADRVCVQVEDWGTGFTPGQARPDGLGLEGIRRRARALGGAAIVQSQPGRGTCVSVEIPRGNRPTCCDAGPS